MDSMSGWVKYKAAIMVFFKAHVYSISFCLTCSIKLLCHFLFFKYFIIIFFLHIFQNYLFICYLCFFLSNTSFGLHGSDTNISFCLFVCLIRDDTTLCLDGCKNLLYLSITQQLDYWDVLKELIQQQGWPFEDRRKLSEAIFFYYFAISISACLVYTSQANYSQISTWILLQNSTYLGYHTYLAVLLNLNCAPFRCKSGRADSTVSTRVSWLAKPRSTWFSSVIH